MTDRPNPSSPAPQAAPPKDKSRFACGANHRAKSHADAQHEAPEAHYDPGKEHPLIPRGAAALITQQPELNALIDRLRKADVVAYDTEFIGELSFHPKLCLLQVSSATEVALIDPLVELDLKPFWELLADPAVPKVVHAGQQDVEPVVRNLGRGPANVFDTQIAAGLAAFPYPVSLSKLVQELTGARLGKGLTFTHWDQRPLSGQQLRYAADDVRYLPLLHALLKGKLEKAGHLAWAMAECDDMCEPTQYRFDPDVQWLRIKGAGSLDAKHAGVLRQLVIWRHEAAREHDVPPRAFLKDEILVDMSRSPVKTPDKFERVRGLPRPVEAQYGQAIIERTLKGLGEPPTNMPDSANQEPSPTDRFRADALWSAAQTICFAKGIDPALVGSRADFGDLYYRLKDGADPSDLKVMTGWRQEAAGAAVIDLFAGKASHGFRWENGLTAT